MRTRELAELAALTALTVAGKEVMNILPNIHPVTLFILLSVLLYGKKAFYVAVAFALVEILLYGASTLVYLYLWPLLVTNRTDMRTIQVGITMLTTHDGTAFHLVLAGVALSLIPAFILFFCLRKAIARSMEEGAMVG